MTEARDTDWVFKKDDLSDTRLVGALGERDLYLYLKKFAKSVNGAVLIPNSSVYVFDANKRPAEIDLVMIHNSGVYVFENKAFTGKITGKINDRLWMRFPDKKSGAGLRTAGVDGVEDAVITFQNPISQNRRHVKALFEFLENDKDVSSCLKKCKAGEDVFRSVVVFSEKNCDISDCPKSSSGFVICGLNELGVVLKPMFSSSRLSESCVETIYSRLMKGARQDEKTALKHMNYVNEVKKKRKEHRKGGGKGGKERYY